jgi:hypothetical protein
MAHGFNGRMQLADEFVALTGGLIAACTGVGAPVNISD